MILSNRRAMFGWLGGALLLSSGAARAMQASLSAGPIADAVAALKPGEFIWAPDVAPDGPVMIIVSLQTQRAYVYRNGVIIGVSTVSTGKEGHETPTGVFTVLQKARDHKSNLYNSAPMPFMQRLTWDGIALHAGNLPGYPASHGCIRLPMAFARQLYGATSLGLTVVITDAADVPRVAPTPAVLAGNAPSAANDDRARWRLDKAATGPISIIISASDRRLLVLRNGVEIGRTPVTISGPVTGASAYTLRAKDDTGFHWLQLPLPGQTIEPGQELSAEERERLHIPEDFRVRLAAMLVPGTTVVLTSDTLRSGGSGTKMTVIAGDEDTPPAGQ